MASISPKASDAELVNNLQVGNSEALDILYDRYSGLVYSLALKILCQPGEAEDLTQEIFLTFWRKGNFDPNRGLLSTYLCVMARSRALNKIKSDSSRQRTIQKLQINPQPSIPTPLEKASNLEKEEILQEAMEQIPHKYRQVLEMNYYQGLSHSQISQQLTIPLGTVKTNIRRGLQQLRNLLGDRVT